MEGLGRGSLGVAREERGGFGIVRGLAVILREAFATIGEADEEVFVGVQRLKTGGPEEKAWLAGKPLLSSAPVSPILVHSTRSRTAALGDPL